MIMEEVVLCDMLDARERRAALQRSCLKRTAAPGLPHPQYSGAGEGVGAGSPGL